MSQFSLEKYIEEDDGELDIAADNISADNNLFGGNRRFSLSLPNSVISATNLAIRIPDNDDFTLNDDSLTDCDKEIDVDKAMLLTSSRKNKSVYKKPSLTSGDARKLWEDAGIPTLTYMYTIEEKLLNWALNHAHLEIKDMKIQRIIWESPSSKCICKSSWNAFLRWIICASSGESNTS
jgi:hypothetical protein